MHNHFHLGPNILQKRHIFNKNCVNCAFTPHLQVHNHSHKHVFFPTKLTFISHFFYLHFFATKISVKSTFDILLQLAVSVSPHFFIRSFFASSFESELHGIVFNIQQMSLLSSTLTQCRQVCVQIVKFDGKKRTSTKANSTHIQLQ